MFKTKSVLWVALAALPLIASCDGSKKTASAPPTDETVAPAYVGTWGSDLEQCQVPQELMGAPMVLTPRGYDQHETHCIFSELTQTGAMSWSAEGACSVEGDQQSVSMTFSVDGDSLTMDQGGGAWTLIRCP